MKLDVLMQMTPLSDNNISQPSVRLPTYPPTSVSRLGDFWTLGNFSKPLATINLPNSPKFLGNFCKGVKIYNFSTEIIFGQL